MRNLLVTSLLFLTLPLSAQPLWSSRQTVGDRAIWIDAKQKNTWYYGPGPLAITTDASGKPVFQLVSLRYTGTALSGDNEARRFTNLLQFSVSMKPFVAAERDAIRQALKLPANAALVPLPIRHLEAVVVSGLGPNDGGSDDNRLRKQVSGQDSGEAKPGEYWTQRAFTVPLDNHEAQILWDQQAKGNVVMSLNYAFYANVLSLRQDDLKLEGDSAMIANFADRNAAISRDTQLMNAIIRADALDIAVDPKQFPGAFQHIDINENSIPPAYAALEVKCFDFALGLRPDLAFKSVEIEGSSVTGVPVTVKTKFSSKQPDVTGRFVAFPYALRMDKPIRYRTVEVPYEGERYQTAWTIKEGGTNLIDASTTQKANPVDRACVDVEVSPEHLAEKGIEALSVHFLYRYEGKQVVQTLDFSRAEGMFFKNICVNYERAEPVRYFVTRKYADGRNTKGFVKMIPIDGYILVSR